MKSRRYAAILVVIAAAVAGYAAAVGTRSADVAHPSADTATDVLLTWLQASQKQREELSAHDPALAIELPALRKEFEARRAALAAALENVGTSDADLVQASEATIAASAALERRVIKYLVTVRNHLTPAQQRQLAGLCAETIREGGGRYQWRRGQSGEGRGRGYGGGRGRGGRGEGPGWRTSTRPAQEAVK